MNIKEYEELCSHGCYPENCVHCGDYDGPFLDHCDKCFEEDLATATWHDPDCLRCRWKDEQED